MTRGRAHPDELRAEAVAAVLAGASLADVARRYGISNGTLGNWLAVQRREVGRLGIEKTLDLRDLIATYLETGFRAMIAQAKVLGDPEYARSQSAHDLAIAHGVLGDKLAGVAATAQALGLIAPNSVDQFEYELPEPADPAPGPGDDDP